MRLLLAMRRTRACGSTFREFEVFRARGCLLWRAGASEGQFALQGRNSLPAWVRKIRPASAICTSRNFAPKGDRAAVRGGGAFHMASTMSHYLSSRTIRTGKIDVGTTQPSIEVQGENALGDYHSERCVTAERNRKDAGQQFVYFIGARPARNGWRLD